MSRAPKNNPPSPASQWTFLSNHGHVLLCIADDPDQTLRDIATKVDITERAVQRIVAELEDAGVLKRIREGRRNHYEVDGRVPLRHDLESHCRVQDLIDMVLAPRRKR